MKRLAVVGTAVLGALLGQAAEVGGQLPYRLHVRRATTSRALDRAVSGAARRLGEERCQRLLGDFQDLRGRPLQARLAELGLAPADYLGFVVFAEGDGTAGCLRSDVLAVTRPGSRVVQVCHPQFWRAQAGDPELAEAIILHETLHTLGLGEDPPSPQAITAQVLARCGGGA